MPCQSDHMEHTQREAESGRVIELLKEIAGEPFDHDNPSYYGCLDTLDADTGRLCDWCKGNEGHLSGMSLELQLWWRRHQKADEQRRIEEAKSAEQKLARRRGLAKLTPDEMDALGIRKY